MVDFVLDTTIVTVLSEGRHRKAIEGREGIAMGDDVFGLSPWCVQDGTERREGGALLLFVVWWCP